MDDPAELAQRLEMLLVLHWLDQDAPEDGTIAFSATTAAVDLDLDRGREGLMALMRALTDLEDRGAVTVSWPGGRGRDARVTLSESVRRDAARQFGRG